MAAYFDLHVHPSFKHYLSEAEMEKKDHCWKTYNHLIGIIKSQSSLEQLKFGDVRLAVNAIYSMEKVFSSTFLSRHLAPMLTLLDAEMMATMPTSNYLDRLLEEIRFFKKFEKFDEPNGKAFKILNSMRDFDPEKLNIILAIEGGHSLETANNTLAQSLEQLKRGPFRFLYLTLDHFIQFGLCTQAYGMKMIKKNDMLKPRGFGLTDLGKDIIDKAYHDSEDEKRILIDIKHMSLLGHKHFYEYRRQKGYDRIPILASHAGFTGISYNPDVIKDHIKNKKVTANGHYVEVKYDSRPKGIGKSIFGGGKGRTNFNPWSINLYNEEIPIILESGGLIGLILDQRIQGAQKVKGEFFSREEFRHLMGDRVRMEPGEFEEDEPSVFEVLEEDELEEDELSIFNKRMHLRHLCNAILHAASHGGERAWKQLCIGSDFDGLIDPINNCTSCAQYDKLEKDLVDTLDKMIREAKKEDPSAEFFESDLQQHVRDIMYENGVRFLKEWFV